MRQRPARRSSARAGKRPKARIPPTLTPPPENRITAGTLTAFTCRWPEGDPKHADFHFCGRVKAPRPLLPASRRRKRCLTLSANSFLKEIAMTPPLPSLAAPAALRASQNSKAQNILSAASVLLSRIEAGKPLDARTLREAMTEVFNASDQDGAWAFKDAYEASEAAAVLFLRKYAPAMLKKAGSPGRYLAMLERLAALLPSHTRRSEESEAFQQFSTPLGLGYLVRLAAQITPSDLVLEPSAGTGLLAIHAEVSRRKPPP